MGCVSIVLLLLKADTTDQNIYVCCVGNRACSDIIFQHSETQPIQFNSTHSTAHSRTHLHRHHSNATYHQYNLTTREIDRFHSYQGISSIAALRYAIIGACAHCAPMPIWRKHTHIHISDEIKINSLKTTVYRKSYLLVYSAIHSYHNQARYPK